MTQLRRNGPYFWVTWLTKLLAGENTCEWAAWFKAQHQSGSWKQVPNSLDLTLWQMKHTARLHEAVEQWEGRGFSVLTENSNAFTLKGTSATLGGKPDLIARQGNSGTIVDIKTGKPSPSHNIQVLTYMFAVPKAVQQHHGVHFDGQVVYTDHVVDIPASAVDDDFIETLSRMIRRLASKTPPGKAPSLAECGFCNITSTDCPERMAVGYLHEGNTDVF